VRTGIEPRGDAGLSCVNLLSATDEADDHRPFDVTVEIGNQELWLGLMEIPNLLTALHEVRRLLAIPCALRFVEDDHVVEWRLIRAAKAFIPKVVDVLDERLHFLANRSLALLASRARELVARQRFLQDCDERTIAG
jgi:hypothetical protein